MKALMSVTILLLLATSVFSQEWVTKRVQSLPNLDRLDSLLKLECQKAVGTEAPSFTFVGLADDAVHTLAEYRGKVALVNFWGTNCSGCRMEMPDLSRLQESCKEQGVVVIFLSSQSKQILVDFLAAHPVTGMKGIVERNQLNEPYQMLAMPSTFLVDKSGIVREMWMGPQTFEQLEKRVSPYVASNQ